MPSKGFRHIDLRMVVKSIELSRKLGVTVFLPLSIVCGFLALLTLPGSIAEVTSGRPHVETIWFLSSFAVFFLSTVLFVQRKRPRPYVMIPSGVVSILLGLLLLAGAVAFILGINQEEDTFWPIFGGGVLSVSAISFGWSLFSYGLHYREEVQKGI